MPPFTDKELSALDAPAAAAYARVVAQIEAWERVGNPRKHLHIEGCGVPCLPPLPATLQSLAIEGMAFQTLDDLPPSLTFLSLRACVLGAVELPPTLKTFMIAHSRLGGIAAFPSTVQEISFQGTSVPSVLTFPAALRSLTICQCDMTELPSPLPASLRHLSTDSCRLRYLPPVPSTLQSLVVTGNPLLVPQQSGDVEYRGPAMQDYLVRLYAAQDAAMM